MYNIAHVGSGSVSVIAVTVYKPINRQTSAGTENRHARDWVRCQTSARQAVRTPVTLPYFSSGSLQQLLGPRPVGWVSPHFKLRRLSVPFSSVPVRFEERTSYRTGIASASRHFRVVEPFGAPRKMPNVGELQPPKKEVCISRRQLINNEQTWRHTQSPSSNGGN